MDTSETASCDSIEVNLVESDCIEFYKFYLNTEEFSVFLSLFFRKIQPMSYHHFSRQSRYMDITSQSTATMSEPRFTET